MAARVGGALSVFLRRRQEPLLFAAACLAVGVLVVAPLACLGAELLGSGPQALRQALTLLAAPRIQVLLGHSITLAAAVSVLALLLGVPLAVLLGRTDAAGRRWGLLIHLFPVFLPPFLLALGWFHLFGSEGMAGSPRTSRLLFSNVGAVVILTLAFTPVVTGLVFLGLSGIDPSLEEAARVVARPARIVRRILLPAAWPAAALGGILVFALSISELGVPMFLRVDAYPAAVLERLGGVQYAPGEAFALVLPLAGIAAVLLFLERRLVGRRAASWRFLGGAQRWRVPLGKWRPALSAGCWLATALSVAPVGSLAWSAWRAGGFSAARPWVGASLGTTLVGAAVAATLIAAAGLVLGSAVAHGRPGARLVDSVALLAFVAPAPVLGVGLIAAWNHAATRLVYGSMAIVIVGYAARYLVAGVRTFAASVAQGSPHLEEAAAAFGGTFVRRLLRILLPMHARGAIAAWLLALVLCMRDLETVVLFYPPGWEPLTVRIFTLEANGPPGVVAALATVQVIATGAALAAGGAWLLRKRPA